MLTQLVAISVVTAFAWMNYGIFTKIANRLAFRVVKLIKPRDIPIVDAVGIAVLPSWFVVTTTVFLAVALVARLPILSLFYVRFAISTLVRGVALGIAEVSVTMLLAAVFYRLLARLRRSQRGGDPMLEQRILGQSGWMRTYQYPFKWLPRPLAVTLVALPLVGEELVFRGTAIPLLLPMGAAAAVAISTALFVIVQIRHLPSWYQAIGPMVGAFVMGGAHGLFFALNRSLVPLLIAHITFFLMIAIRSSPSPRT